MNSQLRQYLFGLIFIAVSGYELYTNDYLDSALYAFAGTAFIVNALTNEHSLERYRKALIILTWVLMGITGFLFLFLLRTEFM